MLLLPIWHRLNVSPKSYSMHEPLSAGETHGIFRYYNHSEIPQVYLDQHVSGFLWLSLSSSAHAIRYDSGYLTCSKKLTGSCSLVYHLKSRHRDLFFLQFTNDYTSAVTWNAFHAEFPTSRVVKSVPLDLWTCEVVITTRGEKQLKRVHDVRMLRSQL